MLGTIEEDGLSAGSMVSSTNTFKADRGYENLLLRAKKRVILSLCKAFFFVTRHTTYVM